MDLNGLVLWEDPHQIALAKRYEVKWEMGLGRRLFGLLRIGMMGRGHLSWA